MTARGRVVQPSTMQWLDTEDVTSRDHLHRQCTLGELNRALSPIPATEVVSIGQNQAGSFQPLASRRGPVPGNPIPDPPR
jgi:hypothetical protein